MQLSPDPLPSYSGQLGLIFKIYGMVKSLVLVFQQSKYYTNMTIETCSDAVPLASCYCQSGRRTDNRIMYQSGGRYFPSGSDGATYRIWLRLPVSKTNPEP